MTRVLDIFSEIESRIGPLERDAKKAREYLALYDEKKQLDVSVWLFDTEKPGRVPGTLSGILIMKLCTTSANAVPPSCLSITPVTIWGD